MTFCALIPWLAGIGAALLGGAIGWILRNQYVAEWRKKHDGMKHDHDQMKVKYGTMETSYGNVVEEDRKLKIELEDWRSRHGKLDGQFASLNVAHNGLQSNYHAYKSQSETDLSAANQTIGDWESKYGELSNQYTIARERIAELEGMLGEMQQSYDSMSTEKATVDTNLGEKVAALAALTATYTAYQASSSETISTNEAEIEALRQRYAAYESEQIARYTLLSEQKVELEGQLENRVGELASLTATYTALQNSTNETITTQAAEIEELRQANGAFATSLGNNEQALSDLKDDMVNLQAEKIEAVATANEEYSMLNIRFTAANKSIANLEGQRKDLTTQLAVRDGSIVAWTEKYNTMEGKWQTASSERSELERQVNELQVEKDSILTDWTNRYSKLQSDRDQLLRDWELKYTTLESSTKNSASEIEGLRKEKMVLDSQVTALQSDKDTYVLDWTGRYQKLQSERDQLKREYDLKLTSMQGNYQNADTEVEGLRREKRVLEKQVHDLEQQQSRHDENWQRKFDLLQSERDQIQRNWTENRTTLEARLSSVEQDLLDAKSSSNGSIMMTAAPAPVVKTVDSYAHYKDYFYTSYLQIIEGIGPKVEGALHKAGIRTWQNLANQSEEGLAQIMADAGKSFRMIKSKTWPEQARLASEGQWKKLVEYQRFLDAGRDDTGDFDTPSKVQILVQRIKDGKLKLAAPAPQKDDLTRVEGIGPKIQSLLNDGGIHTWHELSNTETTRLQDILDAAGSRYRVHKPTTWAQQAALAAAGKWDELKKWQDELNGGK